jgi:hypothetical protein
MICKQCFKQLEERSHGDKISILISVPIICFEDKNCKYYIQPERSKREDTRNSDAVL